MAVPLLDLNRQNSALREELNAAFHQVLSSGHFIMGPEVEAFEAELAGFLGARHAITVSSGTDALMISLMALNVGPGDEVVCPTFTFFATAGSVARLGATPVFADVDPVSFNLDPTDLARCITEKTKAIIPVHLFGQSASMDAIMEVARDAGVRVIEDAAQALGAKFRNRSCGTIGDFGTFSFFPSKNLGGFGDGGLVTTQDDRLAARARLLRLHGAQPKYFHKEVGGNFRMDALQCALLRVKLRRYADYCAARHANAAWYQTNLNELECSGDVSAGLVLPRQVVDGVHIWNQFTLRVKGPGQRNLLRDHLREIGVGTEVYYPRCMHQQACFSNLPVPSLPNAEKAAEEVLSVPIFPELRGHEREEVADGLKGFYQRANGVS